MDNQDKIFNKFKEAAENSEQKDFPGMDKVWARVEDKLDKKEDKKAIALWKKIAIAASLLLLISIGSQFIKSDKTTIQNSTIVNKEKIEQNILEKNESVVSSESPLVPKPEAVKILDKPIISENNATVTTVYVTEAVGAGSADAIIIEEPANAPVQADYALEEDNNNLKDKAAQNSDYSRTVERESAKVAFADKQSQMTKKSAPLIVLNGNAIAHSDDQKRDKMMQAELPNLQPENVDSLVVLDAPLYIIDGIYYSEKDLYGSNPTSPYAPLDKQEIKTITILQDLEATSKYGEKGKKGVVIITTKTGKPVNKK